MHNSDAETKGGFENNGQRLGLESRYDRLCCEEERRGEDRIG
jgi:hypothetical protein